MKVGEDGTVVASKQAFLNVGVFDPGLHRRCDQDKVNPASKVARSSVDLLLPVSIHACSVRVEATRGIPENTLFPTFVSLAYHLATD